MFNEKNFDSFIVKNCKKVSFKVIEYHEYEKRYNEVQIYIECEFIAISPTYYTNLSVDELRKLIKSKGYTGKLISHKNNNILNRIDPSFFGIIKTIISYKRITNSFYRVRFLDINNKEYTVKMMKENQLMLFPLEQEFYYLVHNGIDVVCSNYDNFKYEFYKYLLMSEYGKMDLKSCIYNEILYDKFREKFYFQLESGISKTLNKRNMIFEIRKDKNEELMNKRIQNVETMGYCIEDALNGCFKQWYINKCFKKFCNDINSPQLMWNQVRKNLKINISLKKIIS